MLLWYMYAVLFNIVFFPGVESVSLEDIFPSSPQMQQLMTILQKPGVLEVVLYSSNTPKVFYYFKYEPTGFNLLCLMLSI